MKKIPKNFEKTLAKTFEKGYHRGMIKIRKAF